MVLHPFAVLQRHFGCDRFSKPETPAQASQGLPQRRVGIVSRKNRHTVGGQGLQNCPVFTRDGLHRDHELLVFALCIVHQGHGGRRYPGQPRHFSGMVHAYFNHGAAVCGTQAQQGQGQANVVVEVALGCQRLLACPGAQDAGHHLSHRGFSVAACHRHQRQLELLAPPTSQLAQGLSTVGHLKATEPGFDQTTLGQGSMNAL
jgi:hypothetical protein